MNRIASVVGVLVCVGALSAADVKEEAKKEWKTLNGVWQPTKMVIDGNSLGAEEVKEFKVTMTDGKFVAKRGDDLVDEGKVEIDPTQKPKHMNIISEQGPEQGKARPGIYKLDGDSLEMALASSDKERPTKFDSEAGSGTIYIVYKRVK